MIGTKPLEARDRHEEEYSASGHIKTHNLEGQASVAIGLRDGRRMEDGNTRLREDWDVTRHGVRISKGEDQRNRSQL